MADFILLPYQHVRKRTANLCLSPGNIWPVIFISLYVITLSQQNVSALVPITIGRNCEKTQFTCKDGSCILQEKMCDGRLDCADSSDEQDCDFKMCRKPNWFQCSQPHGPCLSAELICNGIENCPTGEDERDCVGSRAKFSSADIGTGGWTGSKRNCSIYEYTCQMDKSCIPLDFMCDGKADCQDNSDELAGCLKAQASCRGFFCANKKCLESSKWQCDGVDDCGDNSDEQNCTSLCNYERGQFACTDKLRCLELSQVCDGKLDCVDGSDETGKCTSQTDNCTTRHPCPAASSCKMLPTQGPICICPNGYRYSKIQDKCVDINECLENYGICSQQCINTAGSYKCACDEHYVLRADNITCAAHGEEAILLYTTQVTIMGMHLSSKRVYTVAKNLSKVIGVAYDGENIFWTNIQSEQESIVKASGDGKQQEILLTSGLDAPEDLAVDWLTGNIYFTDNVMRHIAACSNDGINCAVLVTVDVHQPRGIALWPQRAQMFWTDWGTKPMIARASMDGSNSVPLVTENIHWPNGIALDMHNDRIYWVDAKLSSIESIRPDGTERHMVLDEILKHPYGLAIFEDQIFWSDWGTRSLHVCNKFTGKNHKVLTKDRTIYAVHVYHSAKQPKLTHGCKHAQCSHLCLLAENNSYACACPDGMQLSVDRQRCVKTYKKQRLYIGIKNTLLEMEHTTFGRHTIGNSMHLPLFISEMAYNSVNGTIFVVDNQIHTIMEYDMKHNKIWTLQHGNIGNITALAFDHLSHNLYWTDSERHVVEVFSLRTRHRAVVSFFAGMEEPVGLAIMPDDGFMYVALRSRRLVHVDQLPLIGQGEHVHVFEDELGDDDIKFATDYDTNTLYWADSDLGRISFSDYRQPHAYTFRGRLRRPYSLAIVDYDLFWTELKSSTIHWTHKSNLGPLKHVEIEVSKDAYKHVFPQRIPLLASAPITRIDHPCQHNNGGCSHVCATLGKFAGACLCPASMVFKAATNRTCIETLDCEFRCGTGECLTMSRRCNGRKDCPDNSDEESCADFKQNGGKRTKVICTVGEFMCRNTAQCIENVKRCDGQANCQDGSDEEHCEKFDKSKFCHSHQHACDNGQCVDFSVLCDGINDCGDDSDEKNCKTVESKDSASSRPVCEANMFQCNSGTCIAKDWECDGKLDCVDASDEHEKCALKECLANMHKCLLGQCIDQRLVCDEHNDCGDMSDEINCDYTNGQNQNNSCAANMYKCNSDAQICLDASAKCNGTAECPRGDDEANCGAICSFYEFQCKSNKQCIRMEFRCDHEHDCEDGSDELNCERGYNGSLYTEQKHERACEAHMFNCKDGQCVDMTRVCDGFADCDTGADEGAQCKIACRDGNACAHKCRATPTGAVCSCFHGFKLDSDKRSCLDINECEEQQPCAQLCENTLGSFRCSCYPDFMLRTDKTSCKSIERENALLFSSYNEVRSMTEQPIILRVAWSLNDAKISGFDVNVRERLAYFSNEAENVLYAVNVSTGQLKAAMSVAAPSKVAVDWLTDNVYVISRTQRYAIKVCSFAAKMCGNIVEANSREVIKAINIDAFNRKLFFVAIQSKSFNEPLTQLNMCNLNGKNCEFLLQRAGSYITALASDSYMKLLYYVDLHAKTLNAINYKLGSQRSPITLVKKGSVIMHPSGLTIYENQAYIVNIGAKEAVRCQLYGMRTCKAFNLNILNAEDIVVDAASRQPISKNPCDMAKCMGMCVQADYGYECMCGDQIVVEEEVCAKELSNEIAATAHFMKSNANGANDANKTSTHFAAKLMLSLCLLLLILAAIGYLYYRRFKPGHRDLNINLHFQNPLATLRSKTTTSTSATSKSNSIDFHGRTFNKLFRSSMPLADQEFLLQNTEQSSEIHALERQQHSQRQQPKPLPNIVVEDCSDYGSPRSSRCGNDDEHDARTHIII